MEYEQRSTGQILTPTGLACLVGAETAKTTAASVLTTSLNEHRYRLVGHMRQAPLAENHCPLPIGFETRVELMGEQHIVRTHECNQLHAIPSLLIEVAAETHKHFRLPPNAWDVSANEWAIRMLNLLTLLEVQFFSLGGCFYEYGQQSPKSLRFCYCIPSLQEIDPPSQRRNGSGNCSVSFETEEVNPHNNSASVAVGFCIDQLRSAIGHMISYQGVWCAQAKASSQV